MAAEPQIELSFQGSFHGVKISTARNKRNETVDVSDMSEEELCRMLKDGELFLRLEDVLPFDCIDGNVEFLSFEPTGDE